MKLESVSAIVEALNGAKVRYLVVGGLAVVAHGYLRFTNDVDLVIQLEPDNIRRTFEALSRLGYRPGVPITAEQFADAGNRHTGPVPEPAEGKGHVGRGVNFDTSILRYPSSIHTPFHRFCIYY